MTRPHFLRAVFAASTTALLIAGGTLLTAAPANAAPIGSLTVTSPTPGEVLTSRAFTVTGTGTDGNSVALATAGPDLVATAFGPVVITGGQFSIPVTLPDSADVNQTIVVTQTAPNPSTDLDVETLTVTLPAATTVPTPTPTGAIVITSPQNGSTEASRTVTFTGTAPAGSTLSVANNQGLPTIVPPITVDSSGNFTTGPLLFGFDVTSPVTLTFSGTDANGAALTSADVTVSLPPAAPAPAITAPTMTTIIGTSVTVSGTGVAGQSVAVVVLPTDPAALVDGLTLNPADLQQTVVVDAQGTWSAVFSRDFGSYRAVAFHVDATTLLPISPESNTRDFTLIAPPVTTASAPAGPMLAETGPEEAGLVGPGALLLLVGGAFVLVSRRRVAAARR